MSKNRKIIACILFLSVSLPAFSQGTPITMQKGKGTEKSPYILESKAQLSCLATQVNDGNAFEGIYFALGNDIDFQSSTQKNWIPIGTESSPFKGIFDGRNFTLSGLDIDNASLDCAGLFGYVYMGKVENIRIVNSSFSANKYVGAVVGYLMGGEVSNCYNEAAVSGQENVGGVVGYAHSSQINLCVNLGTIAGKLHVGGILGAGYGNIMLSNSYNRSDISGYQYVGGVAGKIEGTTKKATVKNCYQEKMSCKIGVLGATTLTNVENCFFADIPGIGNFSEGTKISCNEMKSSAFASKLNQGDNLWGKDPKLLVNSGYPILKSIVYKGIITHEATEITYSDVTLSGSILPDVKEKITRKGFEVWEEGGTDTMQFFVLTNPLYYSINKLKPFQLYNFRVIVLTPTQTLYGEVQQFHTLPAPHNCGTDCTHPHKH